VECTECEPRYNIPPTSHVPAVRLAHGKRQLALFKWGLIPSWAKDAKIAYSTINARSDTVATKPAFRSAFNRSRSFYLPPENALLERPPARWGRIKGMNDGGRVPITVALAAVLFFLVIAYVLSSGPAVLLVIRGHMANQTWQAVYAPLTGDLGPLDPPLIWYWEQWADGWTTGA